MNSSVMYSKLQYYSTYDSTPLLAFLKNEVSPDISSISNEMLYPLYKLAFDTPCSYWNKAVATQVYNHLEELYKANPSIIIISNSAFEHYLMGYNAYLQITESITILDDFNIDSEIKTRMYRLPTYTSIVEGALSNFLRFIACILTLAKNKDYFTQSKLMNLLEMASKNGFTELSTQINVNIRNSINHGKLSIQKQAVGDDIVFYYQEKGKSASERMSLYAFDDVINQAYDATSGVLLGISIFINNHIDLLQIDRNSKNYLSFSILAMGLCLPGIQCNSVNDTDNNKQINVDLSVSDTDPGYLKQTAALLTTIIYSYFSDYEQYMITFSNPRMLNSWIRFTQKEARSLFTDLYNVGNALESAISRNDCILFPPSTEEIDINETRFYSYPNHSTEHYKLKNIQDASTPDRKRLKANMFIYDADNRELILALIDDAVAWMKTVKNPASPQYPQKHGLMPADSIYLNVYREDTRKSKNLLPQNDNFVCFVDFNESGITTLQHGGLPQVIWNQYHHETLGKTYIAWRSSAYYNRHSMKIGRNDPCPCGSGKKYKHCCGK